MAKAKKYQLIVDLHNLGLDKIIEKLVADINGQKKLCSHVYSITTSGGMGKFWKVNEKEGVRFTVSTDSKRTIRVNNYVSVPEYLHYVLTEEGIRYVRELVVEHSI